MEVAPPLEVLPSVRSPGFPVVQAWEVVRADGFICLTWYRYSEWYVHRVVLVGGWRWSGGVTGWVLMNYLRPSFLEDGPDALQLFEGCFDDMGWHATFNLVFQLACY